MDIINLSTVSALIMPLPSIAEQVGIIEVVRKENSQTHQPPLPRPATAMTVSRTPHRSHLRRGDGQD